MGKLFITNEVYAAAFVSVCGQDALTEMQNNPKGFLANHAGAELGDEVAINFADNDSGTVHLALPYYSAVENASQPMTDDDMSGVVGGTGESKAGLSIYNVLIGKRGQREVAGIAYDIAMSHSETAPISMDNAIDGGYEQHMHDSLIDNVSGAKRK